MKSIHLPFKKEGILFALISLTLLTMNFFDHRLSFLSTERFLENEYPSEQFVIFRIIHNTTEERNQNDFGGFMINYDTEKNKIFDRNDKDIFFRKTLEVREKIKNGEKPHTYLSHSALQLTLLSPIWNGLSALKHKIIETAREGSRTKTRLEKYDTFYIYHASQLFVSLLSALCLTSFLLWVRRTFDSTTAWIALGLTLALMLPLSYFGRNLWWMMWSWFMPMLCVLWGYACAKNNNSPTILTLVFIGFSSGFFTFIKASMGYEYTSTVMMSALIPIFFYAALYGRLNIKSLITPVLIIGSLVFFGFIAALLYHYHVLNDAGHDGWRVIKERFFMRAYNADSLNTSKEITKSTQANVLWVIMKYIFEPQKIAIPQILYLLPPIYWYYRFYFRRTAQTCDQQTKNLFNALGISIAIGFIGAISMYVILKGHAYIHGFDVVAWYIPMNLFIAIWAAKLIQMKLYEHE